MSITIEPDNHSVNVLIEAGAGFLSLNFIRNADGDLEPTISGSYGITPTLAEESLARTNARNALLEKGFSIIERV